MVEVRAEDRRALTAGVLRISKGVAVLAAAMVEQRWAFRISGVPHAAWSREILWDGNGGEDGLRFVMQRTLLAAAEQSHGLAELTRSKAEYTVALATLARGALEALGRVNWLLASDSAEQLLHRHGSLEFNDLRYPEKHQLQVHRRRAGEISKVAVAEYRQSITECLRRFGNLQPVKAGLAEVTTGLLGEIYNEPEELYSGMSAAAHGQGWATGNFFDPVGLKLQRDDQMVIEYCAYVTEAMAYVGNKLLSVMEADQASIDRWKSPRDQVLGQLEALLNRREPTSAHSL